MKDIFEPLGHSTDTGNYIRCNAHTRSTSWCLSRNSVDGTINLSYQNESQGRLTGLHENDVACIHKICEQFLHETRKQFK